MPVIDYSSPKEMRFRSDYEEKVKKLQVNWFFKKRAQLEAYAKFKDTYKGHTAEDVKTASLKLFMPAAAKQHEIQAFHRLTKPIPDLDQIANQNQFKPPTLLSLGLAKPYDENATKDLADAPKMRPVDPKTTDLIYKGLPFYGRKSYLKVRNKIKPEKKYYFPECSSYDYGWRFKDSAMPRSKPIFGRHFSYRSSTLSRTGPHADPSHYKNVNQADYTKCP